MSQQQQGPAKRVRWGILGVAGIATTKVIPAMLRGELISVVAIASRNRARAEEAATQFGIPNAYGSYEELLADPNIDAIYNPLPNHLHVPWSIRAAEAGKHVLCEKPIGMNLAETLQLVAARERTGVAIGEAFMVQSHPQWQRTVELVRMGRIGELQAAIGSFGYYKLDAENIRNIKSYGGGGLMDIGCYPIKVSRMIFGATPDRVAATMVRDSKFATDILTSAVMTFPTGQCVFTCGTQIVANQKMEFLGSTGRILIEVPFNPAPDYAASIKIDDGRDLVGSGVTLERFPACDQYTIQGDLFSRAILEHGQVPVPLEDSLCNMAVIDALFRAAETGAWQEPAALLREAQDRHA